MAEYIKTPNGSFLPVGGLNVYVKQMTESDYSDLPESTKNDGHFRVITDVEDGEPDIRASEIVSDDGNVQDDLNALDHVSSIGTSVAIASGTPYTCPSDGYLSIYIYNNKEMAVYINSVKFFDVTNKSGSGQVYGLFVRKGMVISCTYTAGTDGNLSFFPFT